MINPRLIIFITTLVTLSFLRGEIVNGKTCTQPDFRVYCGYCDGKPTVKETAACAEECSKTKWKAANEEFNQCIKDGGTLELSDDMQKEIQRVLPGFKLPIAPDIKLPAEEPSLKKPPSSKEPPKETQEPSLQESLKKADYTPPEKLVVRNLAYGQDVKEGDVIIGEKGVRTVINIPGGSIIDVREGGQIKFTSESSLEAIKGFFKFVIKKIEKGKTFTVRANVAVAAIRGTEFLIESDKSKTIFTVLSGTLEVSDLGAKKTVEVSEGNRVVVEKNNFPSDPKPFNPDSIDRWYEIPSQISPEPLKESKSYYPFFAILLVIFLPLIILFLRNRFKKL